MKGSSETETHFYWSILPETGSSTDNRAADIQEYLISYKKNKT